MIWRRSWPGRQPTAPLCGLNAPARAFIQVGLYGKPVPMDMDMVVRKELKVTAGFAQARSSWEILLKLLDGNSLMLEPLVSTRLPLADWKEGFAQFRDKKGIKIFLVP